MKSDVINVGHKAFEEALTESIVSGIYVLPKWEDYVADFNVQDKVFRNCYIINGSLSCSVFLRCEFQSVTFLSMCLDEVSFNQCDCNGLTFWHCATDSCQYIDCVGTPKIDNDICKLPFFK
ncbi:MAG: hypothetical protein K9M03_01725 [Kiritimatiellales bacterium]|nr:hypothetical protein [Kiritimatiellales bacterium]